MKREYPYYGKSTNSGLVVLFVKKGEGEVVEEVWPYYCGQRIDTWNESEFDDITIKREEV